MGLNVLSGQISVELSARLTSLFCVCVRMKTLRRRPGSSTTQTCPVLCVYSRLFCLWRPTVDTCSVVRGRSRFWRTCDVLTWFVFRTFLLSLSCTGSCIIAYWRYGTWLGAINCPICRQMVRPTSGCWFCLFSRLHTDGFFLCRASCLHVQCPLVVCL